ncbi:uncharacterized protein ALTATR162_LOCUS333 [Alternaria atra]|uniref:Uncharacterized protein n=1 Tax=Alternaria atra TaxID=119953 RepID=A0A8J2HV65_9PLEO|nr:uncharacterized protein ALTATR162_LOCUS333 [Alternaria atra]CAG5138377.1 unnamed protein product [Alternaria atra]
MAKHSTFALDLEISKAWPGLLESTFALDLEISKAWPIFLKWRNRWLQASAWCSWFITFDCNSKLLSKGP